MTIDVSPDPGTTKADPGSEEQTQRLLLRVLDRLDGIESRLDRLEKAGHSAGLEMPAEVQQLGAMVGDIVDERIRRLQDEGLDVDRAAQGLMAVAKAAARPEVLQAAETLADKLPELARLAEDGPKLAAMVADTFDDLAVRAARNGFDLDSAVGSLLTVGLRLTKVLDSPQFQSLFESGVLAPDTLEIIGRAGRALSEQSASQCGRTGLVGALGASSNHDVQRALHFLLGVARRFGSEMACAPGNSLPAANN